MINSRKLNSQFVNNTTNKSIDSKDARFEQENRLIQISNHLFPPHPSREGARCSF